MTIWAILLIGISAVMHASWNLICKSHKPSAAFFLLLTFSSIVLYTPINLWLFGEFFNLSWQLWAVILLTGAFQTIYYISMGRAYQLSDISVAYPLARAIPVALVPVMVFACGFAESPSVVACCGMACVFVGCIILPQKKFSDIFHSKVYTNLGFIFTVLAAVFIASYTVTDKEGLKVISDDLRHRHELIAPLLYISLENISIGVLLSFYVFGKKDERTKFFEFLKNGEYKYTTVASLLCTCAYFMVLCAMNLVENVSYVMAFRQLSIPVGAVMGILILKEKPAVPKLVGLVIVVTGLFLVALPAAAWAGIWQYVLAIF